MFLWRNMTNYPKIISVTPSYLEHCSLDNRAEEKDSPMPVTSIHLGGQIKPNVSFKIIFFISH